MRTRLIFGLTAASLTVLSLAAQVPKGRRLNPDDRAARAEEAVFGVYCAGQPAGSAAAGRRRPTPPLKSKRRDWAREALAYANADFLFNGSMEGGVDRAIGASPISSRRRAEAGALTRRPFPRFAHPLIVKTAKIAPELRNGREQHQPRAEPRRQRHHVRRDRERGRSAPGHCRDALQVEGRHASGRRRHGACVLGHERGRSTSRRPICGRSIPTASSSTGRSSRARKGSRTSARSRR